MQTHPNPSPVRRGRRASSSESRPGLVTLAACAVVGLLGLAGCGDGSGGATAVNTAPPPKTPPSTPAVTPAATPAANPAANPAAPAAPTATVTPATATTPPVRQPVPGGAAQIEFDELVHDFGEITDTASHRTSFPFVNNGNATLVINEVKAACGCTVPTLAKKTYGPGERGQIEIVFDPKGKQGPTDKYITVISNAQTSGVTKLKLTSDIQPLLRFDRMQDLGILAFGERHVTTLAIGYEDPDLEIRSLSFNNPDLSARVVDRVPNTDPGAMSKYTAFIEVTVSENAPWGLIYATRLTINAHGRPWPDEAPVAYSYDMFVTGKLYGDIVAAPAIITLGQLKVGEAFEASAVFSRKSGAPFQILEARVTECNMPGVMASGDPLGSNSNRLVLSGGTGAFRGSVRGTVTVKTDVVGEEELIIRFAGLVR